MHARHMAGMRIHHYSHLSLWGYRRDIQGLKGSESEIDVVAGRQRFTELLVMKFNDTMRNVAELLL
jgi:hypothetical protein